jgi:hypothetical protein
MEDLLALGILEVQTSMSFPARKRGRSRKLKENDNDNEMKAETASNIPAQKRGRPRKIKEEEDDDDEDLQPESASTTITRKRGRPQKQKENDDFLQTEIAENASTTTTTTTTRKRGRPKKLKEDESQQTKTDTISITSVRNRGRPRKMKYEDSSSLLSSLLSSPSNFVAAVTSRMAATTITPTATTSIPIQIVYSNGAKVSRQRLNPKNKSTNGTKVNNYDGNDDSNDDSNDSNDGNNDNTHGHDDDNAFKDWSEGNWCLFLPPLENDDNDDTHGDDDDDVFKDWSEGNWCLLLPPLEKTDNAAEGSKNAANITTITKTATKAKRGRPRKNSPEPQTYGPADDDAAITDGEKTTSTPAIINGGKITNTTTIIKTPQAKRGRPRKNASEPPLAQIGLSAYDDAAIIDREKITKTTTITKSAKARRGRHRKNSFVQLQKYISADNDAAFIDAAFIDAAFIDAEKIKAMLTSNGRRKKKHTITDWMVCIPDEDSSSFPDNLLEVLEMIDGFSAKGLPMTMMILPTDYSFAYEMYHHPRHGARKGIQTRKKLRKRQKNNSYDVDGCNSSCGDVRLAWHKHQQSWSPSNKNDLYSFVKVLIEIACDGFGPGGSGGGATAISTGKMNSNEKGVQIK